MLVVTLGELGRHEEMRTLAATIRADPKAPEEARAAASRWQKVEATPVDAEAVLRAALAETDPVRRQRALDRTLTALELQTGSVAALDARNGFWGGVSALAWHGDRLVVVAGAIHVLDATTFEVRFEVRRPRGRVDHARFLPNGRYLLVGSTDDALALWDLATREPLFEVSRREDAHVVRVVDQDAGLRTECPVLRGGRAFWVPLEAEPTNTDEERLEDTAAVSSDGTLLALRRGTDINVYRIGLPGRPRTFRSAEGANGVTDLLAFSPDATSLAAFAGDFDIALFDLTQRRPVRRLKHDGTVLTFAFSDDGRRIATGAHDRNARVWSLDDARLLLRTSHEDEVVAVALSPDGRVLASGSPDGALEVWDIEAKREVHRRAPHVPRVDALEYAPDGSLIAGMSDGTIRVWGNSPRLVTLRGVDGMVARVQLAPGGRLVATTGHDGLEVWDLAHRRRIRKFPKRTKFMGASVLDRESRTVFFGEHDGTVTRVDVASGREIWSHRVTSGARSMALSHDGAILAVGGKGHEISLLDARTGSELRVLVGHRWMVDQVLFTPDDLRIASRGGDLRVFDVRSAKALLDHQAVPGTVERIALSPDGTRVLVASSRGGVRLLELSSGSEIREYDVGGMRPTSLAFAPDGRFFAAASWHRDCGIWSVETGARLLTLEAVEALDAGFLRTPDGEIELVGGERSGARRFLSCRFGERTEPFEVCAERLSVERDLRDFFRVNLRGSRR